MLPFGLLSPLTYIDARYDHGESEAAIEHSDVHSEPLEMEEGVGSCKSKGV